MTIYSLPKSLIESAERILSKKPVHPIVYINYKDTSFVGTPQTINEEEMEDISKWYKENDNTRDAMHSLWEQHHTDDDKTAVYKYTAASTPLNRSLHAHGEEGKQHPLEFPIKTNRSNFTHDIRALDAAVNRNKLKHGLTTYSGISWNPSEKLKNSPDNIVNHPAYISSTHEKKVAVHFAETNAKSDDADLHILKIYHPPGSTGMDLKEDPAFSYYTHEREFVVPRDSKLKLNPVPKTYTKNGRNVHVWEARRTEHTPEHDLNYKVDNEPKKVFEEGNISIHNIPTLSTLHNHFPRLYNGGAGAIEYHEGLVHHPAYVIKTPEGHIASFTNHEGTKFYNESNPSKLYSFKQVSTKYPAIKKAAHLFKHESDHDKDIIDI